MSASRYDFSIEQGSSFTLSIVYKDSEQNIINLAGYCARLIWRTNENTIKTFSTLDTNYNEYFFTIDEANGLIKLLLPATTTNNFDFKTAKYDLEIQNDNDIYVGGGKQTLRILYGLITIKHRFSQSDTKLDCAS